MPVKLSETPMLYQPGPDPAQLERDLEMFSDPERFDQEDDRLRLVKAEIRAMLDPGSLTQTDPSLDQTRGYLQSLLSSEEEVDEALSRGRHAKAKQSQG